MCCSCSLSLSGPLSLPYACQINPKVPCISLYHSCSYCDFTELFSRDLLNASGIVYVCISAITYECVFSMRQRHSNQHWIESASTRVVTFFRCLYALFYVIVYIPDVVRTCARCYCCLCYYYYNCCWCCRWRRCCCWFSYLACVCYLFVVLLYIGRSKANLQQYILCFGADSTYEAHRTLCVKWNFLSWDLVARQLPVR